jgi:hypothetical protein
MKYTFLRIISDKDSHSCHNHRYMLASHSNDVHRKEKNKVHPWTRLVTDPVTEIKAKHPHTHSDTRIPRATAPPR